MVTVAAASLILYSLSEEGFHALHLQRLAQELLPQQGAVVQLGL